ncbi:MAG: type II toxin-antitoxin system HicB family antitoxin [Schwartzia sp.]|nr:type II toxin-antitoxin system HicB family antitoxin [Schwartzia sp. (in: firmicutes)]
MEKLIYPAIFHPEPEAGGYSVYFPDLLGCVTEGDTLQEALTMAEDALGLYLQTLKEDGEPFPSASNPSGLKPNGDDFATLIEWDEAAYLRRTDTKAVRKTLTIPGWLDTLAKDRNINFSQVLQNALMDTLGVRV